MFFLSLLVRALRPGEKVDTCPVFVGEQGLRKSTGLKALVGAPWFSDSPLMIGELDGMQVIRGKWLWELGELASVSKRDALSVKAFMSASEDTFRASYARHSSTVPRQTCFAASTNEHETLVDTTGNRRFMPVVVGAVDVEGISRDREQLLGEAAARVLVGEQHWETDTERASMASVREAHQVHDAWQDLISAWVKNRPGTFTMAELLAYGTGALGTSPEARLDQRSQNRAGAILRRLGYRSKQLSVKGVRAARWSKPAPKR